MLRRKETGGGGVGEREGGVSVCVCLCVRVCVHACVCVHVCVKRRPHCVELTLPHLPEVYLPYILDSQWSSFQLENNQVFILLLLS